MAIEALLGRLQYRLLRIVKKANGRLSSLQSVDSIGVHSDLSLCDYVAIPQEMSMKSDPIETLSN